jgi:hypothetical protein
MGDFLKNYKKTLEELRRDYPKYNVWSDNYFFTFYGQILEEQIINEFITKTINIDKTLEELRNRFSKKFYGTRVEDNDIIILFERGLEGLINNQFKNIDEINKFMDSFGWFPATINGFKFDKTTLETKRQTSENIYIRYEGKYDTQMILNDNKYYYHLTPDVFYHNIESNGLTPKNKAKISNHPERVYLIKEYDKNEFKLLAERLYYNLGYRLDIMNEIKNYYVLRIDVGALAKSGRDKFYRDPNYTLGIWTYENIPPLYIEKIDEIPVNLN